MDNDDIFGCLPQLNYAHGQNEEEFDNESCKHYTKYSTTKKLQLFGMNVPNLHIAPM
jgi:hypothetical protein